jgi:hypothetical protein
MPSFRGRFRDGGADALVAQQVGLALGSTRGASDARLGATPDDVRRMKLLVRRTPSREADCLSSCVRPALRCVITSVRCFGGVGDAVADTGPGFD